MTDVDNLDWKRLGVYVKKRMSEVGASATIIERLGGPKPTKMREIRNGRANALRDGLKPGLELALSWEVGSIDDILRGREPTPRAGFSPQPRLPRGAPNAPVFGQVDKALGIHPVQPGTSLPMSNTERLILSRVREKIFLSSDDEVAALTEDETRVLTKFIEDDELRTLHVRIDWLPRTEQLEVSSLVNNPQLAVEERWVDDGYTNESEQLPDYAQPNPLPVMGSAPDPRDFPSQVPMFITKEKSNVVDDETPTGAPPEKRRAQEAGLGPAAGKNSEPVRAPWSGDTPYGVGEPPGEGLRDHGGDGH